jgi:hypothetical protein
VISGDSAGQHGEGHEQTGEAHVPELSLPGASLGALHDYRLAIMIQKQESE